MVSLEDSVEDYIVEDFVLSSLSCADQCIKDLCNNELSNEILKLIDSVDSIFNINEENVDEIFNNIKENGCYFEYFIKCVEFALSIRPKHTENIIKLLSMMSKITKYTPSKNLLDIHYQILLKKEIIKKRKKRIKIHKNDHSNEEILNAIINDDVETLIKLSSEPNFNPKTNIIADRNDLIFYVTDDFNSTIEKRKEVTYMQLMAFYSSIKCLKYALMDGNYNKDSLEKYAVAGGNKEIIKLLEQNDVNFDHCFRISVKYNRNEISDWLLQNYKCKPFRLSKTFYYFNNRAFFFIIKNKYHKALMNIGETFLLAIEKHNFPLVKFMVEVSEVNVNEYDNIRCETAFFAACRYGCADILKYLVEKCHAEVDDFCIGYSKSALHYACKYGYSDIVEYLVKECHIKTDTIMLQDDGWGKILKKRTALHYACEICNLDIVKCLIKEGHADVECRDEHENTPLFFACKNGALDVVKYLVKEGNANVESKNEDEETPLFEAINHCHLNIIKYLVKEGNADVNAKNRFGKTALHNACMKGFLPAVKCLIDDCNANLEEKTCERGPYGCFIRKTPLYLASMNDHLKTVIYLVEKCHVNVNEVIDGLNETALDIANSKGNVDVVNYLSAK